MSNNSDISSKLSWELVKENDIKYFQFRFGNVHMFYSVRSNEKKFLEKFKPIFLKQIHSDIIIDVDSDDNRVGDGLLSQRKNIAVGIKIADCLPVYLFNDAMICIIHCGWRSIIKGIAKNAAELLGNYKYVLGASIGSCCYEVKEDVAELFNKNYKHAIIFKDKKIFLDLKAAVMTDLGNKDLLGSLDFCTECHPEHFYSNRRGGDKKRNYAVISSL